MRKPDPTKAVLSARERTLRALYDVNSAAWYLSVSRATIYRFMGQGRLVGFKLGPRLRRFSRQELDRLAEELEREGQLA